MEMVYAPSPAPHRAFESPWSNRLYAPHEITKEMKAVPVILCSGRLARFKPADVRMHLSKYYVETVAGENQVLDHASNLELIEFQSVGEEFESLESAMNDLGARYRADKFSPEQCIQLMFETPKLMNSEDLRNEGWSAAFRLLKQPSRFYRWFGIKAWKVATSSKCFFQNYAERFQETVSLADETDVSDGQSESTNFELTHQPDGIYRYSHDFGSDLLDGHSESEHSGVSLGIDDMERQGGTDFSGRELSPSRFVQRDTVGQSSLVNPPRYPSFIDLELGGSRSAAEVPSGHIETLGQVSTLAGPSGIDRPVGRRGGNVGQFKKRILGFEGRYREGEQELAELSRRARMMEVEEPQPPAPRPSYADVLRMKLQHLGGSGQVYDKNLVTLKSLDSSKVEELQPLELRPSYADVLKMNANPLDSSSLNQQENQVTLHPDPEEAISTDFPSTDFELPGAADNGFQLVTRGGRASSSPLGMRGATPGNRFDALSMEDESILGRIHAIDEEEEETEAEAEVEAEARSDAEAEAEAEVMAELEAEARAETEVEAELEAKVKVEVEAEAEAEEAAELEAKVRAEAEVEAVAEAVAEVRAEAAAEAAVKAEAEAAEAAAEAEAVAEAEEFYSTVDENDDYQSKLDDDDFHSALDENEFEEEWRTSPRKGEIKG